jgi:uncharacterized protein (DUF3084 family)
VDFASIFFLIVIVVVSGFAAYWGDNLGKKIGKKRLSFAGLRPRHFANVATFFMGMGLSLLTISLVLFVSAPVRSWIFRGSKAIAEAQRVTRQLQQEKASLASVQRQEAFLRQQLAEGSQTVATQKVIIAKQDADIMDAKAAVFKLNANIAKKNESLYTNQKQLDRKELELANLTARLEPLKNSLRRVKAAYNKNLQDASKVFHNLESKNEEFKTKNEEFRDNITRQKKELAELTVQMDTLQKSKLDLENTRAGLVAELDRDRSDLREFSSELTKLTDNLTQARTAKEKSDELSVYLQKDFVQTRLSPLIFSRFQEVARLSVPANLSSKQADDAFDSLLVKAQNEAAARGGRPQGGFKVADIIDRPDGTTADQIKKMLHDKLVGNHDPVALIAVASFNSYEHEPIAIDVLVRPNPVIYRRGEVLEQTDLNGEASDTEIIRELTAFGASLRDKAEHDQMIPRSSGDAFGSVPADQVLTLVNGVRQAGRVVRLQAIVQSDTRAADPLRLDFRFR